MAATPAGSHCVGPLANNGIGNRIDDQRNQNGEGNQFGPYAYDLVVIQQQEGRKATSLMPYPIDPVP
jgi:hypothetical protein